MEITYPYSFQVDSEVVNYYYENHDNFLIEYSDGVPNEFCSIYFSSNDIYYPNNERAFINQLAKTNRFEWYNTRLSNCHKHIFIRDVFKQWHLKGINSRINNPDKLFDFLLKETKGYKVITLGSSAGGFSAVIFGQLLKASKILSFNGNFEIYSKLQSSTAEKCPLIFRFQNDKNVNKWFDSVNFISDPSTIFYFQSIRSNQDIIKYNYIKHIPLHRIQFYTSHHGIPFLKGNLPYVLNYSTNQLIKISQTVNYPILFSFKTVGVLKTIVDLISSLYKKNKKMIIRKFLSRL